MADFKVTPAAVTEAGNRLNDVRNTLARYDDEVKRVAGALNFKIASAGAMRTKVNSIAKNIGTCSVKAGTMSTGAAKIASLYTKTENELKKAQSTNGSDLNYQIRVAPIDPRLLILLGPGGNPFSNLINNPGLITVLAQNFFTKGGGIPDGEDSSSFSWLKNFLGNNFKKSGDVLRSDPLTATGEVFGFSTAGSLVGSLLHGEAEIKNNMSLTFKDKDGNWDFEKFGISSKASATGAVATGEAEGNIGYLHGKAKASALTGTVSGEARCGLYDDGKFNPSLSVGGKASASALQGSAEAGFGVEHYDIHAKASGDVLHAEAEAKAGVGYIGEDKEGNARYGLGAEASAMASVAQGKASGGITIFGIDIDVGVKGYAVAAGVEAGASIATDGVKASLSGALGLGAGLDISVDWSGFDEWATETFGKAPGAISDINDFFSSMNNWFR